MTNWTNRRTLLEAIRRAASVLADFAYGIDAASAIRHGMPAPARRGRAGVPGYLIALNRRVSGHAERGRGAAGSPLPG